MNFLLPPLFTHDHTQLKVKVPTQSQVEPITQKGEVPQKQTSTSVTEDGRRITKVRHQNEEPSNFHNYLAWEQVLCAKRL